MSLDPTNPTAPTAPIETTEAPKAEEPPAWFKAFAADVDGRLAKFGQDFGRIREKLKEGPTATVAEPPKEAAITRDELIAAERIGSVLATLPQSVAAKVRERAASQGYTAALDYAETLSAMAAELGGATLPGTPRAIAPTGQPATGAKSMTPATPRSQAEFFALRKSDPTRFEALMADPNFDPGSLPYSSGRVR